MLRIVVGVGVIASLGACLFVIHQQQEWSRLRADYFAAQWRCDAHYHSMINQKQKEGWCSTASGLPGVCRYGLTAEEQMTLASRPACYEAASLKAEIPFFLLPQ